MRYLLDTNFISELRKCDRANRGVQAWALANDAAQCAVSVLTIGEIREGIENVREADPRQANAIEKWLDEEIEKFGDNILPVTLNIADTWGRLMSSTEQPDIDLILAATALAHDLTIVTRNVADFEKTGVRIVNPWK